MDGSDEQEPTANRTANASSRRTRARLSLLVGTVAIAAIAVAGWYWFERDREPFELTVGAGPYRSDSYQLMREVAEVVERHSRTLLLKVVATRDSSRNISILNGGEVDLATIRSDTPVISNIRLVAYLFSDYFQILTHPDSGIFSVTDLLGKKVAIPPFGSDEFRSFWIIGDHYDLPVSGVNWFAMDFEGAANQLQSGEIDALFTVRSLRDRLVLDLFDDAKLKDLPVRLLEIDQAPAIALKRPFLRSESIPKGTYDGDAPTPSREIVSAAVNRILVTRSDVDETAIRELTRVLFEHRLDLTIRFALASAIGQPDSATGLSVPLHAGAAQFYNRDEPSFIQENAEPLALLATLIAMSASALFALRSRFVHRQKNRMDSYNYLLLDIADRARASTSVSEIAALKSEMTGVLERVVGALDTDEVTDEGFQSFSFLWESIREILTERQSELETSNTGSGNHSS